MKTEKINKKKDKIFKKQILSMYRKQKMKIRELRKKKLSRKFKLLKQKIPILRILKLTK